MAFQNVRDGRARGYGPGLLLRLECADNSTCDFPQPSEQRVQKIGVRSGAPRHDIRTAEAVKETLLSARSITFVKVGSATPVIEKMIERLGIAGVINPKIVRADQAGRPADLVSAGKIDLVIAPAAAIVPVPGRRFSRSVAGGVSDVSRPDRRYWYAIRKTGWCQGTCRIH